MNSEKEKSEFKAIKPVIDTGIIHTTYALPPEVLDSQGRNMLDPRYKSLPDAETMVEVYGDYREEGA